MISGRTAIITGAAQGIGEAIAREFVARGAKVALVDCDSERGGALAQVLNEQEQSCCFINCDITSTKQVNSTVAECEQKLGAPDILVNNAGFSLPEIPITELSDEDMFRQMDVNVFGMLRFCRATFAGFSERGRGAVINIASVHQWQSWPGWTAYAASKGAIVSLTRQLAVEWAPKGIRVNSVSPGGIETELFRKNNADETGETMNKMRHMHALERTGHPEEIAKTVAFLASDDAGFITGEDILADGGMSKLTRI